MDASAPPPRAAADEPPHALRELLAAVLEALRTRLDLAAVELEIHLRSLLRMLVWAIGAVACAMLALAFAVTALVVAVWDTHRMLALLLGSLVFVALTAGFAWLGVRTLRFQPGVLESSLEQLAEDQRRTRGSPP
ncbi:MAG TPA: phage holin family protein [Steroidobacteraceae bacterium]|nr:phage holin family protein [Steroidobacteraceae bacterium]